MTAVSGAGGSPSLLVNGLVSGLNTPQVIQALLQSYMQPVYDLKAEQANLGSLVTTWQKINSDLSSLQSAAQAVSTPQGWQSTQAASSDSSVATGATTQGAQTGSVSFTVNQLAAADTLISSGSVAASTDVITSSPSFLLSSGGAGIGFASFASGSGLALGSHSISVTQASASASTAGSTALASSTTITTGTNDTVNVTINGTAYTATIAGGTYTPAQLASQVATAINTAVGSTTANDVQASVNSNGEIALSTQEQGSAASLQVTGGNALATLGLTAMSSAALGTNAVVSVDGYSNTISSILAGSSISLTSGTGGTIASVIGSSSHISAGQVSATNVSTGNGSLSDVVSSINAANAGISAAAVQSGSGYYLELASTSTGTANNLSVDTSAFAQSSLGTLSTLTAGANAQITLGTSGSGPQITSSSNTFQNLLPGLNVNVLAASSSPVTITVSPDETTTAAAVKSLVDAANAVLGDLNTATAYDSKTHTAGPLLGNPIAQSIKGEILSLASSAVGTSGLDSQAVGISVNSDGTLSFNSSTFQTAFAKNPGQVASLFTQGGTFSPTSGGLTQNEVSLAYASNSTAAGAYSVDITNSASQATDTGSTSSTGSVSTAETLTVKMGTGSVQYTTTAGETLSQVASALNTLFSGSSMAIGAQVQTGSGGSYITLTSNAYGSSTSFSVSSNQAGVSGTTGLSNSSTGETFTGTDVAGTINGVAATGSGQFLSAPASDPTLAGLSLQVTSPAGVTGVGTFNYSPGMAQQLASYAYSSSNPLNGSVTSTIKGLQGSSAALNPQINFYQSIVNQQQKMLQQEFANMEALLGSLKNQGSMLQSAIAQLP
ncbi:MAG: flagellar filament capping protein FliD [Actinomycetota bacterium]|nr:flagellar filament capping protein FliD [Actinomycetota bacterium]